MTKFTTIFSKVCLCGERLFTDLKLIFIVLKIFSTLKAFSSTLRMFINEIEFFKIECRYSKVCQKDRDYPTDRSINKLSKTMSIDSRLQKR